MRKFALSLIGLASLAASAASAEVVKQDEDGFVTRNSVAVDATPREVWMALISPGKWWNSAHTWSGDAENMTITPQAGGCFCERIPANDTQDKIGLEGSVRHMVVIQATPDVALRMRGGLGPLQSEAVDGVLTIAMGESDKGTTVAFEYVVGGYMRFEVPVIAKAVDGVMAQQLDGLASLLGKAETEPQADADAPAAKGASAEEKEEPRISVDEAFRGLDDSE